MPNVTLRELSQLPSATVDALLIWPRGGNAGDLLITDACERYLRDRGIQVWRTDGSVEEASLADDTEFLGDLFDTFTGIVIVHGSRNIGIYPDTVTVGG